MLSLHHREQSSEQGSCDGTAFRPVLFDSRVDAAAGQDDADRHLLDGLAARHLPALGAMHDRYAPSLYGLCLHLAGSQVGAELLLVESFLCFWVATPVLRVSPGGTLGCLRRFAFLCRPPPARTSNAAVPT